MSTETVSKEKAREYAEQSLAVMAKLYYCFAKELADSYGDEGIEVLKRAIHRFGTLRGRMIRETTDRLGLPPTVANHGRYYDMPRDLFQDAEIIRKEENYLEKTALSCPMHNTWKQLGSEALELGRYYCEQDAAMRVGYNEQFVYEQNSSLLAGDGGCHSILKLKDEER